MKQCEKGKNSKRQYHDQTAQCNTEVNYTPFLMHLHVLVPSVHWHCWLGVRKSIQPVKIEWRGAGVVICPERDADCLHMVQLVPCHPKTPSFLSPFKSRLVLPFSCLFIQVVLEKRPLHGCTIRYDTRCYFNVHSKADMSQLNLPHGTDN